MENQITYVLRYKLWVNLRLLSDTPDNVVFYTFHSPKVISRLTPYKEYTTYRVESFLTR